MMTKFGLHETGIKVSWIWLEQCREWFTELIHPLQPDSSDYISHHPLTYVPQDLPHNH